MHIKSKLVCYIKTVLWRTTIFVGKRGSFMKRKSMLMIGLCGAICVCIMGFTHGGISTTNASELGKSESVIEDIFFNDANGGQISTDGENWVSQSDYKINNSDSQVEWWTATEYENWIAEQEKEMMALIGTGKGWYDGQGIFHEFTPESVDAVIAEYQEILKDIKNGMMYSKSTDDGDSFFMIPPSEDVVSDYSNTIMEGNGESAN